MAELTDLVFPVAPPRLEENEFISPAIVRPGEGQAPVINPKLPSLEAMKNLSVDELSAVLEHYGIINFESIKAGAEKYLERVTNIPKGSRRWQNELNALLNSRSQHGAMKLARRVSERWNTMAAIDGDINAELIWVSVDDDDTCSPCFDNGGEIKTFSEWTVDGLPGAET